MEFEVIRMPQTEEQLEQTFQQNGPFLSAMYTENDEHIHGPENFYHGPLGYAMGIWRGVSVSRQRTG